MKIMKQVRNEKERMPKMGGSDNKLKIEGHIFRGALGTYKVRRFVGSGGNGSVYEVEVQESDKDLPESPNGYVIKFLSASKDQPKRKERFKREIDAVSKLQNQVRNIIPIYDYSCGDKEPYWFLMPKAKNYQYYRNLPCENLRHMYHLCSIILELHQLHYAHRDIKPDNILIYDGELCLSDYGLIWEKDTSMSITSAGEALGPFIIRPPEFEKYVSRVEDFEMFRASDVYLFAKTLWITLSKKRNGFFGEYSRHDTYMSLQRSYLNLGRTIEPLHLLLEGATKDNYLERISIEECMNLIETQLQIFENTMPISEVNRFAFSERMNAAKNIKSPDTLVYLDSRKIVKVICEFSNEAEVVIENAFRSISLGRLYDAKLFNNEVIILKIRGSSGKKEFYISIDSLTLSKDEKCTCVLKRITSMPDSTLTRITEINEIELLTVKKALLDSEIRLHLSCFA